MATHYPLAIVIPAYKSAFLREALDSVASQSCRRFQLYVGDDASPENIGEIVREYSDVLPINYLRFEKNLGRASLVKHWERCIRMGNEPWVWLFSDDDVMEADCIESFFRELRATEGRHDLYRFNTISINRAGTQLSENPQHPQNETGADFLVAHLRGGRKSTAQELIFSRAAWASAGGFPDFPLAWASDDAFIAILGLRKPIRVIAGPRLKWRSSGQNISTLNYSPMAAQKFQACREFVLWAADFFKKTPPTNDHLVNGELNRLLENWFFQDMIYRHKLIGFRSSLEVDKLAASSWHHPRGYGFLKTMKFNCNLIREKLLRKALRLIKNPTQRAG
ncbi:MAG TPA: glycosyltransferase family 2 protein [Candidatus Acidoferrales bacterium]|jgi:glycosyltransferase involved in cell wall biosynthesis|nr:glycosyltransferase family 2 protein [Candidatus Acidoferrales bacterium]